MSLKKINSIYFHQKNQVVKSMCQNHRIKQGVKKQKTQVTMEICNTRPHFPSKYTKIKLNDLKINALLTFITHQSLEIKFHPLKGAKDVAKLSLTCKDLRYHSDMSNTETVSEIAKERKNAFENEVNQFVNLFKDDNGNFKHSNDIANEINNGTIMLHQDPFVLKEGVKTVFSNISDVKIKDLLVAIKDNISQDKLAELACISIEKMTVDIQIRRLLLGIKDNLSQDKLDELASIAFEKMSTYSFSNLLNDIKDKIDEDLYNKLKYNIFKKNILEKWKTNK